MAQSIEQFNEGIISGLEKEAEKDFGVKINRSKAIIASASGAFGVALAPIKSRKNDLTQFAMVKIFSKEMKSAAIPKGTFLLGRAGKKSFLKDDGQNIVVTGNVHAAPRSITIDTGTIVITIGGGNFCIYWDDPIGGGPFSDPKCWCYCFAYLKKA